MRHRLLRTAKAIAFHTACVVMTLTSIKASGLFFQLLYPATETLFGTVRLSYMIDAMDAAVFFVLIWKLTAELWDALS